MTTLKTANSFRKYHRLLGYFLAGIMSIYSISGVLMIYKSKGLLQYEQESQRQLKPQLAIRELEKELHLKNFKILTDTPTQLTFREGSYDKNSGIASLVTRDYHPILQKFVKMHKASVNSPLYFLNVFFGVSLLFFSISAFFMFIPKSPNFRTGLKFAAAGFILALIMVLY